MYPVEGERRRYPRFTVRGSQVNVVTAPLHGPLTLLEVGRGGFLVCGPEPLPLQTTLNFVFVARDGKWQVHLEGRVIHAQSRSGTGAREEHVSGVAFLDTDVRHVRRWIDEFLAALEVS